MLLQAANEFDLFNLVSNVQYYGRFLNTLNNLSGDVSRLTFARY